MRSPAAGRVSMGFSPKHQAVDIVNTYRSPIAAPIAGQVVYVGQKGTGVNNAGLVVEVKSGAYLFRLCHLDSYNVRKGDTVYEGQLVGLMGHTGYTIPSDVRGTHCHVVMEVNGKRDDIRRYVYIPPSGSTVVQPPNPNRMPPIGSYINLIWPPNQDRTTFRAGTTTQAGTIRVRGKDYNYLVRGYDNKYPNRIIINSASAGGNGIALACLYTNGQRIEGWKQL